MAVINSYYLYQKYEKRGNQPWIPCYPNTWSVDADGTMPPVLKQQDDPSCYHPIYRWVQTQDTICIDTTTIEYRTTSGTPYCDGYDKYVDTTYEQSFDGGVTWEFVSSSSTLVEQDSEYCGYEPTPEVQYRWTESGTTCDNANKYKRYIKEVSYDGGEAWLVVQPPQYSAGTLVESDSYDCGYRTSATTSATYCSNANQYVDVYSLVSRDYGVTWSTASTSTELIEEDVVECGFSARTISTATTCVGVDKHYLDEYQESRDTGTTWTTISSSTGSLIESQSTDCGYSATTVSSATYCSNANQYVDVYSIVSTDYGQTWITASTSTELVDSDVYECGYRTRTTTGESYCDNANEYAYTYNEVSRDYGNTWTTASTSSVLVQSDSYDCGYRTGTTSSSTYCNGDDLYVDVYYRVSRDTGTTWTTASTTPTLVEAGGCATPTPTGGKFTLTLSDSSTVTAECDSTSAITSGEVATQYSGSVVSAEIGSCVTSIGFQAFYNCTSLTSVTIPDSVTSIGQYTFRDCTGLTNVNIPTGITSISRGVFYDCYSLSGITIPSSVTSIGRSAFWGCSALTSIDIPNSVTTIDITAFYYCSGLTSVTIYATTPPTLGTDAFYNTNNCPIYVPCESVSAYQAATNWSTYASRIEGIPPCGQPTPTGGKFTLTLSDSSTVTAECDSTSAITQNEISAYSATVVSAEIGSCVTSIGRNAFRQCASLTSVTIPNNVTNIDRNAFYICTGLTSISIPHSVTTIGNYAFSYCSSLTSCTIGSGVTSIGDAAFSGCTSLTSITCYATTPPTLATQTTYYRTFENTNDCPIYVPCDSVSAYKSDSRWSTYASRIEGIPVPSDYDGIYEGVLSNGQSYRILRITGSKLTSGNVSSHREDTVTSNIGTSVTAIDDNTFSGFTMLKEANIASTVTSIGNNAFKDCPQMNVIIVNSTTPPTLGSNAFDGTNDCPIQVPCGYASTYKSASGWSTYASRII